MVQAEEPLHANVLMWVVIDQLHRPLSWWLEVSVMDRVWWLAVSIAAGAGVYFLTLLCTGLRPSKLGIRPH